jgi:hypothetical protein
MPKVVWVRSLVPKEKNSATSAMAWARHGGARQFDHGADEIGDARRRFLADDFAGHGIDPRLDEIEFLAKADQRHHDFRHDRRAGAFAASTAASKMARACISAISG